MVELLARVNSGLWRFWPGLFYLFWFCVILVFGNIKLHRHLLLKLGVVLQILFGFFLGFFFPKHVDGLVGPVVSATHVSVFWLNINLHFLGKRLNVISLAIFVIKLDNDGLRESYL